MKNPRNVSYLNELYVQVLIAIFVGGLIGYFWPQVEKAYSPSPTASSS
jgi:Na+/H+-dicarboxylate symporter